MPVVFEYIINDTDIQHGHTGTAARKKAEYMEKEDIYGTQ